MNQKDTPTMPVKRAFLRPFMMVVLWPAFIAAAAATGVFFSVAEPFALSIFGEHTAFSPESAYTLAFLGFWALASFSSLITAFLLYKTR